MKKFLKIFVALLVIGAAALYVLVFWPLRDKHPVLHLPHGLIAVRGATIYVSPDKPPIHDATLVARDGRIVSVGSGIVVPEGAEMLACKACTVTAGFWNMHVHFTEAKWNDAAWQDSKKLNTQLTDMLTSRGFTTAVDLGSDPRVSVSLRRRIENGELNGPFLYLAGRGLYPENGIPFYIRENTPNYLLKLMPQPATPAEAKGVVQRNISLGADVLKLFTGSYVERGHIKPMRTEIVRAAVEAAHQNGQIAFAHPSNLAGVNAAVTGGVDVLAHAPDTTDGIDDAVIAEMARAASMIPTLKMFATTVTTKPAYLQPIYDVVRRYREHGGNLLFGTDVGYMEDYSTADEYAALERCGLSPMDILQMLTRGPAVRMGVARVKGTLEVGKLADFVLLRSDPANGVNSFSNVVATVRSGKVIWRAANY